MATGNTLPGFITHRLMTATSLVMPLAVLSICCLPIGLKGQPHMSSPHEQLEMVAASVNSGNTKTILDLTNAVLMYPHNFQLDSTIVSLFKPMVQSAEMAYRQGTHQGVREEDVITALNYLAPVLKLPEYASTTPTQIHQVRIKALFTYPRFMGLGIGKSDVSGKFKMNNQMSPLQAVHLLLLMADLKFTLPEYQVTPIEWETAYSTWQASKMGEEKGRVQSNNNPRTHQLYNALHDSITKISELEVLAIVTTTLRHLGVD